MTTGERMKLRRKSLSLSAEAVAERLGVSAATIYRYEKGDIEKIPGNILIPISEILCTTPAYLMGWTDDPTAALPESQTENTESGVRIPVVGAIRAGIPITAIEEIEDWEEIPRSMARTGDYIALRVKGDSMEPTIADGDIAIIRRQETIENGQIAAVIINGDEATLKQVKLSPDGIILVGFNVKAYEPHFYSNDDIANLPVRIYGRLVEVRRKF